MNGIIFDNERFVFLPPDLPTKIYPSFFLSLEGMRYQVSNYGTVIDLKTNTQVKQSIDKGKTTVVLQMTNGESYLFYVESIVLAIFQKKFDPDQPIAHKNGYSFDDRRTNLMPEYLIQNGRVTTRERPRQDRGIFTDEQKRNICQIAQDNPYLRPGEIAKILELNPKTIRSSYSGINITLTSILMGRYFPEISCDYDLEKWRQNYEASKAADDSSTGRLIKKQQERASKTIGRTIQSRKEGG